MQPSVSTFTTAHSTPIQSRSCRQPTEQQATASLCLLTGSWELFQLSWHLPGTLPPQSLCMSVQRSLAVSLCSQHSFLLSRKDDGAREQDKIRCPPSTFKKDNISAVGIIMEDSGFHVFIRALSTRLHLGRMQAIRDMCQRRTAIFKSGSRPWVTHVSNNL